MMGSEMGHYIQGKMTDGSPVRIYWFDDGKIFVPDPGGVHYVFRTRFETDAWQIKSCVKLSDLENASAGMRPRLTADRHALEEKGVDIDSLEIVPPVGTIQKMRFA